MELITKALKKKRNLCFLDFEGTQFSHEIIAIGAVKASCDEKGNILGDIQEYKRYVKPVGAIGKIVTNLTSIDLNLLKEQGITIEEMFDEFKAFIGDDFNNYAFITFGSNDDKMILSSINIMEPSNKEIGYSVCKNTVDFLPLISQFVKDKNGNNYSLTNYLALFNKEPHGKSHDPLNDAYDLMNLYKALNEAKDIVLKEYKHVLKISSSLPKPVRAILNKLLAGENVTPEDFDNEVKDYLK
jgi:hypothetical protein